mgnify:CR=1 FL=1
MRCYHDKKEELPECPVAITAQLIGNKWKLLILRNLRMRPWRFNELQKSLEGISQKVLTQSLRSMEADGSSSARFMQKFRREWNIPSANWVTPCVRF